MRGRLPARIETTLDRTNGSFVGIHRIRRVVRCGRYVVLLALGLAVRTAAADGVHAALLPGTTTSVAAGDTVQVGLCIAEAGAAFNAYAAVVDYDTTALVFLPTSPTSLQEGALMKGACGSTFHVFKAAADSLSVSHALMCAGVSVSGPGELYHLRFRARDFTGVTWIHIRRIEFYDAGPPVEPAASADAWVLIGGTLDVPAVAAPGPGPGLGVRPNPCRAGAVFLLRSDRAGGQRLEVFDIAGRSLRVLARGDFPAGERQVAWDGADATGRRLPPGVYPVVFTAAGRRACARAAVVR